MRSRYVVSRFVLVLCALLSGACQVVSRLSSIEVAEAAQDAGALPLAKDASVHQDAGCVLTDGAQCDPIRQCGCGPERHCQFDFIDHVPHCVPIGSAAQGGGCREPAECPSGQTCDRATCRAFCAQDSDCVDGTCVPAAGSGSQDPVKVCWARCDESTSCAQGAACRALKTPYAETGMFCAAALDPCPTVEDGQCDEASGTGMCADGTDAKDCACRPSLPGASCDPLMQCGCADGSTCELRAGPTAGCVVAGTKRLHSACKSTSECKQGLVCDPTQHLCVQACGSNDDCMEGACLQPAGRKTPGLCHPRCSRAHGKPCAEGTVCASLRDGNPFGLPAPADYCVTPLETDCPSDDVCDEPRGTALCKVGSDGKDCCKPPAPDGECNPVLDCGCANKPDTQCRHVPFSATTMCTPAGHDPPWAPCSGTGDNCPPGYACGDGACRPYCATSEDCGSAGNVCVLFNDRQGRYVHNVGVCFMACDYTQEGACPAPLVCARNSPAIALCVAPYKPCPDFLLGNGVCDDQRPGGSRRCELNTDPDCD
jgi:hypothetical protein